MDKIAMNVKEMAKHLGVSAYTAYQLTKRPGFPTLKIGKRIAIPVEQFMDWIARHAGKRVCAYPLQESNHYLILSECVFRL